MLKLEKAESDVCGTRLEYNVRHSMPGVGGTVIEAPLVLIVNNGQFKCEMKIEDCCGNSPDEALDKMARWLTRLSEGIQQRSSEKVPI